ncbi:MAG: SCP2 domain-containing protein [Gammaproteobacteria bacterium]|nr:MAG: SCP2 domain-containing protein [Gammaproteobacteria bacterium]RLA60426.1 MAG: SCP2 domain-containing protein [Gammaproteobacteria bacterium]
MSTIPQKLASLPGFRLFPWAAPLRLVPKPLQLFAAQNIANQFLRGQIEEGELDFLEGLIIRIRVRDLGYDWGISKLGQQLIFVQGSDDAEGSISGDSHEFLLLAGRREDADTLFFQRRLVIEGNTELGLQVKNLIDSIDLDEFPAAFNRAIAAGADFAEALT